MPPILMDRKNWVVPSRMPLKQVDYQMSSTSLPVGAPCVSPTPTDSTRLSGTGIETTFKTGAFGINIATSVDALSTVIFARSVCLVEIWVDAYA
jgi:hypothetical protein